MRMTDVASHLAFLHDPRLAVLATSAAPAWLWSTDASRILWANPVGAAIFDAPSPAALAARRFDPGEPAAAQIARLVGSLRPGAAGRLERLRGFGAGFGRALTCACSRIALADHTPAILVIAAEPAGPSLALAERIRRLLDGSGHAAAAFAGDGSLIQATPEGRARLGPHASLTALGAERIGAEAAASGRAEGELALGRTTFERLGAETTTVLLATFAATPAAATPPAPQEPAPMEPALTEPQAPALAEPPAPASPEPPDAPPGTPATSAADAVAPATAEPALPDRRHPLRFVWQMDAGGRFTLGSDEFTEVIGPGVAVALGRPWHEIANVLALDPEGQVERAVASRDTWSGITVSWPVDGSADRLKVELSGLPIFDRNRSFLGYRGFGVCRDVDRIATLAAMRRLAAGRVQPPPADVAPAAPEPDVAPPADITPPADDPSPPEPAPIPEVRPTLTVVPAARNVVPFRSNAPGAEAKTPALSPVERNAFHELARQLTARLKGETARDAEVPDAAGAAAPVADIAADAPGATERPLLDRVPVGLLVYRLDTLLYANRAFLDWTGHDSLDALAQAGGLDTLFVAGGEGALDRDADAAAGAGRTLAIATPRGDKTPVEARLFSVPWEGESALALMLVAGAADARRQATETALRRAAAQAHELQSILDTATDGVVVIEPDGRIVAANRSAEALFGYDTAELMARRFAELFAPTSRTTALEYLSGLVEGGSLVNGGREVTGQVRQGGALPLVMTLGRIADGSARICAVFRDVTPWKKTQSDLVAAREAAERASAAKSDFLAKVSHEIRTPLNSIIGFSEVMLEERFGPIGNERYRDYLKDIRSSGEHVVALLNDLLDLAKIEAGKLELAFASLNLNEVVQGCVALMQPQANRERIIIRTSLSPTLRPVVADARSVRQIVLNLLSNSIKFTGAGGQVIVSTVQSAGGDVMLRVRDTGIGMDDKELSVALEPFRQLATAARWGAAGTGLGLPLTRALVEQNRARFTITSKVNDGTLVEVAFPPMRVPAE
jgi:PAS domain S-box-containing protein